MCFHDDFKYLTGHGPFPWQEKMYNEFVEKQFRKTCPIPTGLGKTSVIAVWLLALAHHARLGSTSGFPRRLVYVVNRRTVVDQSTGETEKMRKALIENPELQYIASALQSLKIEDGGTPLAISTLRGQFADNGEWRNEPSRASVVVGTVDMIGSRLLFSGYGSGFKSRPLHAGFLGQDTLLVHDEAHLEPAFQELIAVIEKEQTRCHEFGRFRVMELTATSRTKEDDGDILFTVKDMEHPEAKKRMNAKKGIKLHPVGSKTKIADEVLKLAKKYKESGEAILIFLREPKDVKKVAHSLSEAVSDKQIQTLTGTMRGWERDALARKDAVFARFMLDSEATPQVGTVYLVCTSAGEVGVNISADHLICDLTPFDSMAQRFGRVNRFGEGDAFIDIVYSPLVKKKDTCIDDADVNENSQGSIVTDHPTEAAANTEAKKKEKSDSPYDHACAQTLCLLQKHLAKRENDQRHDASPAALSAIPTAVRQTAFTPPPVILPATDILFDAWALTSIRQKLPGRPPVADWLHGVGGWEPPATYVAWREEVELIAKALVERNPPEDLLEDYPLKPHELLRDRSDRVFEELEKIAGRGSEIPVWLIDRDGKVEALSLTKLTERNKQEKPVINLADCIVILPPGAGGLSKTGMLEGGEVVDVPGGTIYDVADKWLNEKGRVRRWDDPETPAGMRRVRIIDTKPESEGEYEETETTGRRYWYWYVRPRSADDDGSRTARVKQELSYHLRSAEDFARKLTYKLELSAPEASAVILAARWHDRGKDRLIWQRSIGNHDYPKQTLAKSGPDMRPTDLTEYRHEFGSLIDIAGLQEFGDLSPDVGDLVLHLVAAHHGRARPHFTDQEALDHNCPKSLSDEISAEVPRRFARLQRKYGRWGLAYLESLVRATDILASQAGGDGDSDRPAAQPGQGGDQ